MKHVDAQRTGSAGAHAPAGGQFDPERIRAEVRRHVEAIMLGSAATPSAGAAAGAGSASGAGGSSRSSVVTEADVAAARAGTRTLYLTLGAIVTPLARDAATRYGVELIVGEPARARAPGVTASTARPSSAQASMQVAPARPAAAIPVRAALSPSTGNPAVMAPRKVSPPAATAAPAAGCQHVTPTIVAVASDHGGFALKAAVVRHLEARGLTVIDFGTDNATTSVDYPDLVTPAAAAVAAGDACRAILVDTYGSASAMTANKVPGVRATASPTLDEVASARGHGDANVLCLGQQRQSPEAAFALVDRFLAEPFGGGRHARRLEKVAAIERAFCAATSTPGTGRARA